MLISRANFFVKDSSYSGSMLTDVVFNVTISVCGISDNEYVYVFKVGYKFFYAWNTPPPFFPCAVICEWIFLCIFSTQASICFLALVISSFFWGIAMSTVYALFVKNTCDNFIGSAATSGVSTRPIKSYWNSPTFGSLNKIWNLWVYWTKGKNTNDTEMLSYFFIFTRGFIQYKFLVVILLPRGST